MREHVTVVESSVEGECSVRKNWALMLYEAANPAARRLLMHAMSHHERQSESRAGDRYWRWRTLSK